MTLEAYFTELIRKIEESDIQNNGKDDGGFFEPTHSMLLQRANLLRDLHAKPNAKPMVKMAWQYVVDHAPPEWLILDDEQKRELKKILE